MFDYLKLNSIVRLGMSKAVGIVLADFAEEYPKLVVLTADVAHHASLDTFADLYPDKLYNVGIAEQNLVAMAAGLAKEGCQVFVITYASFLTMRSFEAIRSLNAYMNLNVKFIGINAGVAMNYQGNTHYALEDIALMSTVPNMLILSPADCYELVGSIEFLLRYEGCAYLRLTGIPGHPLLYKGDFEFNFSDFDLVKNGTDVAMIATGSITKEALRAARGLEKENISCAVFNAHVLKPINHEKIFELIKNYKMLVTVEEHFCVGGVGSILADILSVYAEHPPLLKIAIDNAFIQPASYNAILKKTGINAEAIKEKIKNFFVEL